MVFVPRKKKIFTVHEVLVLCFLRSPKLKTPNLASREKNPFTLLQNRLVNQQDTCIWILSFVFDNSWVFLFSTHFPLAGFYKRLVCFPFFSYACLWNFAREMDARAAKLIPFRMPKVWLLRSCCRKAFFTILTHYNTETHQLYELLPLLLRKRGSQTLRDLNNSHNFLSSSCPYFSKNKLVI